MTARRVLVAVSWALLLCTVPTAQQSSANPSADVNSDGIVNNTDLTIVQSNLGRRCGQANFDKRADVNADCVVNVTDIGIVSRSLGARFPPTINATIEPPANQFGWHNKDIVVTFTCTGASTCPGPVTLASEGPNQVVERTVSNAGGEATARVVLNIDKTPPLITAAGAPPPNPNGWRNQDVVVSFVCSDAGAGVASCPEPVTATLEGADTPVSGVATDRAGNTATASLAVSIDKTLPSVVASTSPVPTADGWNKTDVVVTFTCSDTGAGIRSCSPPLAVQMEGPNQAASGTGVDNADNTRTIAHTVQIDKTPPTINATISPPPNAQGVNTTDVTVTFACSDTGSGIATCPPPILRTSNGAGQLVSGTTADRAGNTASASVTLNINKPQIAPVSIAISAPSSGQSTRDATATVIGSITATSAVTVTVNAAAAVVTGTGPYTFSATVPLVEGPNVLTVLATDVQGNSGQASVLYRRDTQPPQVGLVIPDRLSRSRKAQARAEVSDPGGIAEVVFRVNGAVAHSFTLPPFVFDLTIPDGARNGDTLEVSAEARDRAGNVTSISRSAQIAADGLIVGQVLSDLTGQPISGASVRTDATVSTTDELGRYVLREEDASAVLSIEKDGMTSVQRLLTIGSGVGTVPVDARLTPRSNPRGVAAPIVLDGYELARWSATIVVPPGALGVGAQLRLTALSPQGLPLLLPLGWSPVAAFELMSDAEPAVPLGASVDGVGPARVLVRHDPDTHSWRVADGSLTPTNGSVSVSLELAGTYALLTPDPWGPPITIPDAGGVLTGVDAVPLPTTAVATAHGAPPSLPSTGGLVRGIVVVQSPTPVPSGTIVQASLSQTFELAQGGTASDDKRHQDIILYRAVSPTAPPDAGVVLESAFPIVPTRTYAATDLAKGNIHVEVLSGRESSRGVIGGSAPLELTSGTSVLAIPAGALTTDTAVDFREVSLSGLAPVASGLTPLFEVEVDLSGALLLESATLSQTAVGLSSSDRFLLATVERLEGIPYVNVVALARMVSGRLVSVPYPGLPGIRRGGRYVFYRSTVPFGFVGGTTSASTGPVPAVVSTAGLPFLSIGGANGAYLVPSVVGVPTITARVPATSLAAVGSVDVLEGTTATLNLSLSGSVTMATVAPAHGAQGVPVGTPIDITASTPINAATAVSSNVRLFQGQASSNNLVPTRLVLSLDGRHLSIVPDAPLGLGKSYTLVVTGLADRFGGLLVVPGTTFTTTDGAAPGFDTSRLIFSMPDANGDVEVVAQPGSLPPGTLVFIINSGNGAVVTFTALNDGALAGTLPASVSDVLMVTVTDPQGRSVTFSRSQYVAADGTTAVGRGGGVVRGSQGTEVRVPEGALDRGVTLKVEAFDAAAFPERPDFPEAQFSSGLRLVSPEMPTFKKPVSLAFPLPTDLPAGAKPEDAFYYVYRRVEGPDGRVAFEVVDHAFVQGEGASARVVTASYPFPSVWHSLGSYTPAGLVATQQAQFYLMLTLDSLNPGIPLKGVVTGRVLRPTVDGEDFEGIPGLAVSGVDASGHPLLVPDHPAEEHPTFAITQSDGTFTLWDSWPTGGTVTVATEYDGTEDGLVNPQRYSATGFQSEVVTSTSPTPALKYYQNRITVNITLPAVERPPVASSLQAFLFEIHPDDQSPYSTRGLPLGGFVPAGRRVLVGIKDNCGVARCAIRSVELDGQFLHVDQFDPLGAVDMLAGPFEVADVGVRHLAVAAQDAFGKMVTTSMTFQVVAAGGNSTTLPDDPPFVIDAQTSPRNGARSVGVDSLLRIVFSEPVTNVPGHIQLTDLGDGSLVPAAVIGTGAHGELYSLDAPQASGVETTALTVRPTLSLKFGTRYRLTLTSDIRDRDPLPKSLSRYETEFETLVLGSPDALGGTTEEFRFGSPGLAVVGTRAYLVENDFQIGFVRVFDITNPLAPAWVPTEPERRVFGRPMGIAAQAGPSSGVDQIVVVTGPAKTSIPSNLYLFDVTHDPAASTERIQWVGAATLSATAQRGIAWRTAIHGSFAYALTTFKGLQVVDLKHARQQFVLEGGDTSPMRIAFNSDGQGWGEESVVATIPVTKVNGKPAFLSDLKVDDFVIGGFEQPLVVIAGEEFGMTLVDPFTGYKLPVPLEWENEAGVTHMGWGHAVALSRTNVEVDGRVAERRLAVVSGNGREDPSTEMLMVVDVTDPVDPRLLGYLKLPARATDLVVRGSRLFVAEAENVRVIDLSDPFNLREIGVFPEKKLGGWLTVADVPGTGEVILSTARAVEPGQTADLGGLRSAVLQPRRALASLVTPSPSLLRTIDVPNHRDCMALGTSVTVDVYRPANVSLSLGVGQLTPLKGYVDSAPRCAEGDAPIDLSAIPLSEGRHVLFIPTAQNFQPGALTLPAFSLVAVDQADPSATHIEPGQFVEEVVNRRQLLVGRTMAKGVDLFDGHLVRQATDIKLRGRNFDLDVVRTYSSHLAGPTGELGAGWSWSFGAALEENRACGCVTVQTTGGSQTFRTDNWQTFRPQKGYHSELVAKVSRVTPQFVYVSEYEFKDKSGTRYRFVDVSGNPPGSDPSKCQPQFRLEQIIEPHGDRLVFEYDVFVGNRHKVRRISERHPSPSGETTVRALNVTRVLLDGDYRITKILADGEIGLSVEYRYESGNLVGVLRKGTVGQAAPSWLESYSYDVSHRMTRATGASGDVTEYDYSESVIGQLGNPVIEIREYPRPGSPVSTRFKYNAEAGSAGSAKTTVTDPLGKDTVYTMNAEGGQIKREEPLGRTSLTAWHPDDILKTSETDPLGRETRFSHDDKGNLTSEIVVTSDMGEVETRYEYEHRFNKLTRKVDAEDRETRFEIDPLNGDVREMVDAVGNRTVYRYDAHGQLLSETDPRGFETTYSGHTSFGDATVVTAPVDAISSIVTTRVFDSLGRMTKSSDTSGHALRLEYDQLDRVVRETRVAGTAEDNDDAVTERTYYPGGQVKTMRAPGGAVTEHTLDGMNRVVRASTDIGADDPLVVETDYDENGNKSREQDRRGVERTFDYDELNRLVAVRITGGLENEGPVGVVARFDYDLVGNKKAETDVAGLTTRYSYDGLYNVSEKLLPETGLAGGSLAERYTHDRVGNRTSITDPNGNTTTSSFDGLNRVTRVTNALGQTLTTTYADTPEASINKTEEHDLTRGLRTTFAYDARNRETLRAVFLEGAGSSGEVLVTRTEYLDQENVRIVTDPRGFRTRVVLDGLERVVEQVVDLAGLRLTTGTTYDGLGNPRTVTDPNGNTTVHAYDPLGRHVGTKDALGHETTLAYDGEGLKISETDRRGVTKAFTYDNLERPRRTEIDPTISGVAWSEEVQYNDAARTRTEIDARGKQTVLLLDGLNRVVKRTDAKGKSSFTTWDGVNKRSEKDRRGNTTLFDYDALNRLTKTTDPAPFSSQTFETTYDDERNEKRVKDRRGAVTTTRTDPLGRVLSIARAGAVLETNGYDENGNKATAVDAEGHKTAFGYDAANRLIRQIAGAGTAAAATTVFEYDKNGNHVSELDARAAELSSPFSKKSAYDELNRLISVTDGEGGVNQFGYDEEGHRTRVRDAVGNETSFDYDELGALLVVTQPGNVKTRYAYDESRNHVTQTDGRGNTVTMQYDELNRLTRMIQPGDLATIHGFDENGNEVSLTDPKGQVTTSIYDELNHLKRVTYAALPAEAPKMWRHTVAVDYTRDENGNLVGVEEWAASGTDPPLPLITTREYDDLDRLISDTTPLPDGGLATVTYTYFANGSRKTITTPGDVTTSYTYDGQNRLETVTTDGGVTRYTYYADGLQKEVVYPNGVVAIHQYDLADRATSIVNGKGEDVISSYAYTYDKEGNRLSQVEVNGRPAETTSYTYDTFNRLLSVSYPVDASFPNGRNVTYVYDAVGNRERERERDHNDVILVDRQGRFDSLNRLMQLEDLLDASKSVTFAYDRNGNQTEETVAGVTTKYVYDSRDKFIEMQVGPNTGARFQYDFEGKRNKKIGEEDIRQYVYDGTSLLMEFDVTGDGVAKYDYAATQVISVIRRDEVRRFFSFDALDSVVSLTDDLGLNAANYRFDAWGTYRFTHDLTSSMNRMSFTGHTYDSESTLLFAKARYYDSKTGRFITNDVAPIDTNRPSSLHKYLYASANPTRYVDPDGTSDREVFSPNMPADEYGPEIVDRNRHHAEAAPLFHFLGEAALVSLRPQIRTLGQTLPLIGYTLQAQYVGSDFFFNGASDGFEALGAEATKHWLADKLAKESGTRMAGRLLGSKTVQFALKKGASVLGRGAARHALTRTVAGGLTGGGALIAVEVGAIAVEAGYQYWDSRIDRETRRYEDQLARQRTEWSERQKVGRQNAPTMVPEKTKPSGGLAAKGKTVRKQEVEVSEQRDVLAPPQVSGPDEDLAELLNRLDKEAGPR